MQQSRALKMVVLLSMLTMTLPLLSLGVLGMGHGMQRVGLEHAHVAQAARMSHVDRFP
jgi:hypothetical protein